MKIHNEIQISAPPDELFDVLSDVERVAPLLPGASLEGKEDEDTYKGTVKVKVGPITTSYRGTIRFSELDREGRRAVMRASGNEIDGQGSTEATITATVTGTDSESVLAMDTDMEVRGKVAQFGRGAIGAVSGRILDRFAHNLEAQVLSGKPAEEAQNGERPATAYAEAEPSAAPAAADEDDALSIFSVVALPAIRRAAPGLIGLVLGVAVGTLLASRRGGGQGHVPGPMGHGPPMNYGPPVWYVPFYPPAPGGRDIGGAVHEEPR